MLKVAILVWIMLGTVIAGVAFLSVLMIPELASHPMKNIPFAVLCGFLFAMPLSYVIATRIAGSAAR